MRNSVSVQVVPALGLHEGLRHSMLLIKCLNAWQFVLWHFQIRLQDAPLNRLRPICLRRLECGNGRVLNAPRRKIWLDTAFRCTCSCSVLNQRGSASGQFAREAARPSFVRIRDVVHQRLGVAVAFALRDDGGKLGLGFFDKRADACQREASGTAVTCL